MRISKDNPFVKNITKKDKNILILFFSILIPLITISIMIFIIEGNTDLVALVSAKFFSLFFSLGITGILSFKYHRKSAIISLKKILKWFALIALVVATITLLLVLLIAISITDLSTDIGILLVMAFIIFIIMFLIILVIIAALFFFSFGMVGVIAAVVRGIAPDVLLNISKISANKTAAEAKNKKTTKLSTMDSIICWLFAIPDVLETKTLKINQGRPRNWFPWSNFYKAIWWQTLFGTVIIVYISFNPLYVKSELDFRNLFSIASNFTLVVPFFILPWFIFLRLDAKIKGQVKDYELYRGIVYRMYQTFFTLGTFIIILRIGLERIELEVILLAIPMYYIFFMSTMFLLTFIYFNYFENGLAWEVAKRYRQIKD